MGATWHRPWPDVKKKKRQRHSNPFLFRLHSLPTGVGLPFSASPLGQQPEAARAEASRRRNDEKPRSISDNRKNGRRERERSLGSRVYAARVLNDGGCPDRPGRMVIV